MNKVKQAMRFLLNCFLLILISSCSKMVKPGEKIVYLKSAQGNFDLYSIDVLGQWEEKITTNPGYDWQAAWNEGLNKMVYYTNDTSGNFSVVAMDLSTQELDTIPFSELSNYKLSPKGDRIFYTQSEADFQNIWTCDLEGRDQRKLTNSESYNGRFSISADGQKLAFISDRTGSNELFMLDLSTDQLIQLTNNNLIEKYNTWSPTGDRIAVTMREDEPDAKEDIYIFDIHSLKIERLTNTPYAEQEIAWSLSGEKIAFHGTTENDGDQIYTIDLADGKFTKITSGDFYHGEPAWVPINENN